jgi:nicotinamidase-related amidase
VTEKLSINTKTTALLVMDFQSLIVEGYSSGKEDLLPRTVKLLEAARKTQILVIYIVVGFRAGHPEVSPRNLIFQGLKEAGRFSPDDAGAKIHPSLAPKAGEIVIAKHRVGAFAGTDLDMILRAHGVDTLLLTGIATSGVVLSTVRHAADADYSLLVVHDCCSDRDPEVHNVLTQKVFPRQAAVISAEAAIAALA